MRRPPLLPCLLLLLPAALLPDAPAATQDVESLAAACGGSNVTLRAWCQEVALGVQALQRGAGLSVTGGSDLPGTGSTLGRRLGSVPRIAFTLGGNLAQLSIPGVLSGTGPPASEESFLLPSAQLGARAGILDGISLAPTIGGILSLDVFADLSWIRPPRSQGFRGGRAAYGVGARVGVFRESFTLPGVSLSASYRSVGSLSYGSLGGGDLASVDLDVKATSIRAVISKSIMSLAVVGGMGWDQYSSDVAMTAVDPISASVGQASVPGFETSRGVYFAGLSKTFLVLQISGEVGWAAGSDDVPPGRPGTGFDPTSGTLFGGVAFRLTF